MNRPLSRTERNRRAMNGLPMDAPPPLIRKSSERNPMMDLDAMDQAAAAELEIERKAQLEEKERSRAEHQMKLEAPAQQEMT